MIEFISDQKLALTHNIMMLLSCEEIFYGALLTAFLAQLKKLGDVYMRQSA
ncbi:hypothetical protein HED60_14015 [Planctomycetales bacterium ZRK34]|nr:hypothetical protein HED60_14015 [Planctomycetales bacterium ZRK34]